MQAVREIIVRTRLDADQARREARKLAACLGFTRADAEAVALATSELAMNLHRYAPGGVIRLSVVHDAAAEPASGSRQGVRLESDDHGPGIEHPDLAMQDGYSTGGGLGSGLPSVRRLMDNFSLTSTQEGTRVVAIKWLTGR